MIYKILKDISKNEINNNKTSYIPYKKKVIEIKQIETKKVKNLSN